MVDQWIVLGGWGVTPDILSPVFGDDAILVDGTDLASNLIRDGKLLSDWEKVCIDLLAPRLPRNSFGIAGWSTGAIMAWAIAQHTAPSSAIYLSATPSFRRRPGFSQGQRPSVVRAMREKLLSQPSEALDSFYTQCGIGRDHHRSDLPGAALVAGLHFLEQVSLLPLKKPDHPILFLHGRGDAIIPIGAGRYFSEQTGGTLDEFDGPHAFFVTHRDVVRDRIKQFMMKVNE
jgi:pimeloyl-ACP methyl ester carboxylesterase